MRFRHGKLISPFEYDSGRPIAVAGELLECLDKRDTPEGRYWSDRILIGTEECCHGTLEFVGSKSKKGFWSFPIDTNVIDLQPVVIGRGVKAHPYLGVIVAGYGCNGNGVRLLDSERPRLYDLYDGRGNENAMRVNRGCMIRPDLDKNGFFVDNMAAGRFGEDLLHNLGARVEGYEEAGYKEKPQFSYNSVELPAKLENYRCQSVDVTQKLREFGVDIEASLGIAKKFVKTRRAYEFGPIH